MKAKEFDELIKQKFDLGSLDYDSANWQRMSAQLSVAPEKRKLYLLPIGISVAASLLAFACIMYFRQNELTIQLARSANNAQTTHHNPAQISARQDSNPVSAIPANNTAKIMHLKAMPQPVYMPDTSIIPDAKQPEIAKADPLNKTIVNEQKPELTKEPVSDFNFTNTHQSGKEISETSVTRKEQFLSFGGGYNYGSLGSGYAVSATARKNITDKLYVEGDLGFANNTLEQNNIEVTSHPVTSNIGITSVSYDTLHSSNKNSLYYLQFTPAVGYNVYKHLSVGVGADVQKLISGQTIDGTTVSIADIDLGITGKAEYALSRKVRASIIYREGINNLISAKNYADRNYVQFQLKYRILGK